MQLNTDIFYTMTLSAIALGDPDSDAHHNAIVDAAKLAPKFPLVRMEETGDLELYEVFHLLDVTVWYSPSRNLYFFAHDLQPYYVTFHLEGDSTHHIWCDAVDDGNAEDAAVEVISETFNCDVNDVHIDTIIAGYQLKVQADKYLREVVSYTGA
ncbi:hypothetical protein [Bowmanella sp. JS7-9]|uniref:Uncharacterized protein n=1 Tax=Pseudobowmanella zhangzhouensis TaxID=1537679 RepID=A0ABW1XNZ4_9ALTE|nr:hypothetical protein [Bowmanella sp. JS7-9]TBX21910.1 hypothetical protein TK45_10485 [Bowmanella sp. JS7-9]